MKLIKMLIRLLNGRYSPFWSYIIGRKTGLGMPKKGMRMSPKRERFTK